MLVFLLHKLKMKILRRLKLHTRRRYSHGLTRNSTVNYGKESAITHFYF